QRKVYASGHASGRVKIVVLNPDRLGIDLDVGIALCQLAGEGPVGSDPGANGAYTATVGRRLLQPAYSRRVGLPFLNANPSRDQQRVDLAPKATEISVAIKRQPAHAGDLSICRRCLRVDDFDVIKRLAARGPVRRSEDVCRPD